MSKTLSSILKGGTLPVIHGGTGVTISTGTGAVVLSTSPALITPELGIATATTINKVAFTTPTSNATLTLTGGKTLSVTNTLTFSGTDDAIVSFRTGGTPAYKEETLATFSPTTSEQLASILTDETGTGNVVFSNNPTLISPTLGDAAASSISITNSGSVKFFESTVNGVNFVGIKSPANLAADYTLTLPNVNGLPGQVIATDGTGQLKFADADAFGGNRVYVSATKGSDTNDGFTGPVRTIKRALQIASGLVYNSIKAPTGVRVNVNVAAGEYVEDNPIIIPDNVSVVGDGLRACIIRPLNANKDLFRVRTGCYFTQFTFRDGISANGIPAYTWDYCIAFDDVFDTNTSREGYINLPSTKPTMTLSPYVQNCTAISFLGGNGGLIDGSKIANPNVPANLLEVEVNPAGAAPQQGKSMVAAAFTMVLFGGTSWRVVNDAYVQLVSCFQLFSLNGIYTQSGGYASVTNSATNFGIYALRSSGYSPVSFTFDRGVISEVGFSGANQTITAIGFTRPDGPVQQYVVRVYSTASSLTYNVAICQRDIGFVIDALRYDMMFGSNFRSIKAGMSYYTAQASTVVGIQKDATIASFTYLRDYVANSVNGDPTAGASVFSNMNIIINIISTGLSAVPTVVIPEPPTILPGFSNAARLLNANKAFIQDEVTAFMYANFQSLWTGLTSNQRALCTRDMGYVIDAIRYDLTYGGNLETAVAARLYKNQLTGVLVEPISEQVAVTAVYARLKAIIGNILTNNTSWSKLSVAYDTALCQRDVGFIIDALRYDMMFGSNFRSIKAGMSYYTAQAVNVLGPEKAASVDAFTYLRDYLAAQVNSYSPAATSVTNNLNTIIDIINNGLSVVPTITIPEPSNILPGFSDAARLINENKAFIQDEIVAYLNTNYNSLWTSLSSAQKTLCTRDMGYIVDAIRYDLTYGGNLETAVAARLYKNQITGLLVEPISEQAAITAVYARLKDIIGYILTKDYTSWTRSTGNTTLQVITGNAGSTDAANFAVARFEELRVMVSTGVEPTVISPNTSWVSSNLTTQNATLVSNKSASQTEISNYVALRYGLGNAQYVSGTAASNDAVSFTIARFEELRVMVSTGVEPSVIEPGVGWVANANLVVQSGILQTNSDAIKTFVTDYISTQFGPTDLTSNYKRQSPNYLNVTFNAATAIDIATNVFTTSSLHNLVNGDSVVYNSNGLNPIGGMFTGSQYFVVFINTNQFKLAHDDSLSLILNVTQASTGLQSIIKNDYELYVENVIETHHTFQTIVLNNNTYTFVPGEKLEGLSAGQPNSANVYSFDGQNTLVVAINNVTIFNNAIRKLFSAGSSITKAGTTVFNPGIEVISSILRSDLYGSTFTVSPTLLDGALDNTNSLAGKQIYFHRPSVVNSSGHTWEYAGSGIDYNALPVNGGQSNPALQQYQENAGRVYSSGTNELGDFQVGDFITAYNRTGNIVFKNTVTVSQLNVLKLALSDISIDAISNDIGLGENEISGPADNKMSTQRAIWMYFKTRVGSFIDKSVSTNAVPGAVVQLNASGQINSDLIPAQRAPTALIRLGYRSRLTAYEDVPSVNLLAGDTCTEKFQTLTITLSDPVTVGDNQLVVQLTSGATGYVKGDFSSATSIVIASEYETFTTVFTTNSAHTLTINGNSLPSTTGTSVYCLTVGSPVDANDTNVLRDSSTNQYLVLPNTVSYTYTLATISKILRYNNVAYVITTANHSLVTNNQVKITSSTLTTYTGVAYVTVLSTTRFSYPNVETSTTASATTTGTAIINAASNTISTTGTVTSSALSGTISVNDHVFGGGLPLGSIITAVNMSVNPRTFTITFPTASSISATSTATLTFITPITETGTVRSVITAVNTQAQGEITEVRVGMVTVVNNLTLTGGTLYTTGTYYRVPLTGGAGSGALANITVASGSVKSVDLVFAGTGYGISNNLSATLPGGSGFSIAVSTVETRLYVNNLEGGQFTGSSIVPDFITDNNSTRITIVASDTVTKTFNASSSVDYVNNIITINSHGLLTGDPVMYSPGINASIGGLSIVIPYYVIKLTGNTIRLSTEYNGSTYVSLGTSSAGTHSLIISSINTSSNRVYIPNHGLNTGDALTITGATLPSYVSSGTVIQIADRQSFFVGAVTTNAFTLHLFRADALVSVSGSTIAALDFNSTGSNTFDFIHNHVQIVGFSNTSSKNISNWGLLTSSGIDASNIISGTVSSSRLANVGIANSTTYLRGDSSWATAVSTLKSNSTSLTLNGSGTSPFYGAVTIDIAKATYPTDASDYSTMGIAKFNITQFDVGSGDNAGRVFIKAGVVDAGTLDTHDSAFYLNPANFTDSIPVNKGGTGLTNFTVGDFLYANSTLSLSTLRVGPANTILSSNGTLPYWADSLTLATIINTNAGEIASVSTGNANVFNTNALSMNIGGDASSISIGASSSARSITSNIKNYTTSGSATTSVAAVIGAAIPISTVARNGSNVATIVTASAHGLTDGDTVTIVCNTTSFNAINVTITVVNTSAFTYNNTGTTLTTVVGVGTVYTGGVSIALYSAAISGATKLVFAGTSGIIVGQLVQCSAGIPAGTLVTGLDSTSVYLSNAITTDIISLTTIVFTHTNTSLGIRSGDQITVASSGITNLDGTWPVTSAGASSTSFTIKISANVTLSASPRIGTIIKINSLILKNRTVTLGSSEASTSPVAATLKGENAVGTNISANDFTLIPGLATGTGTTGNFIVKTGAPGVSGDITQTATTRLTINGNGLATFANSVVVGVDLEARGIVVSNITSVSAIAIKSFSATTYRSAKFILQVTCTASTGLNLNTYQVAEVLVVHNGTTAYMVEYGDISTTTSGNMLATFTCDINSGNVRILAQATATTDTISVRVISDLIII